MPLASTSHLGCTNTALPAKGIRSSKNCVFNLIITNHGLSCAPAWGRDTCPAREHKGVGIPAHKCQELCTLQTEYPSL